MRLAYLIMIMMLAIGCEHGKGGGTGPFDAGSDGGGSGTPCGGFGGDECAANEFCDFPRDSCGAADELGTCRARPGDCPDLFDPVCGCDGQTHPSPCDAAAAGVDVNSSGGCPLDPGQFACGFRSCNVLDELCQRSMSDVGGEPDSFSCQRLPACPSQFATCDCLVTAAIACADLCTGSGATGLTVTCPGG